MVKLELCIYTLCASHKQSLLCLADPNSRHNNECSKIMVGIFRKLQSDGFLNAVIHQFRFVYKD